MTFFKQHVTRSALSSAFSLVALAAVFTASAKEVPIEAFARLPEFNDIILSPDGRYIAASVPAGDQTSLAVIQLSDMKVTAAIRGGTDIHVARMWWASPERVLVALADSSGPLDVPALTGELMAVDADGKNMQYLFGYRGPDRMSMRGKNVTGGLARVVSALDDDDDHVMISSVSGREVLLETAQATLYRLDVRTAKIAPVARAPIVGFADFVVDEQGRPLFAFADDEKTLATRTFRFGEERSEWTEIGSGKRGEELVPLRVSRDGTVFVEAAQDDGRTCLSTMSEDGKVTPPLACDPVSDLVAAVFSTDGKTPLAAVFEPGTVVVDWVDDNHTEAVALHKFANSFPGQAIVPTSRTRDGSKFIIRTFSDRNPGDYFLYDVGAGKAQYLLSSRGWIDPKAMAERRPIEFASRDGVAIHGYLTLPPGGVEKNLPLIVHPHGGPFGTRDHWGWDADSQLLASRGYAVLQVNFRGSGGYGAAFHEAAREQWGTMMIDDITDGARWAVEMGVADRDRMCIYGGSYGGYASMMSAVREPDLYKCVIAYAGVYDLKSWMSDTDVSKRKMGRSYMRQYVGDDPAQHADQSPLMHIDRLKAPVFIVHGKRDKRVPYNQATQLRDALEKREHPFEWLVKSDEGHGFYRVEARAELYERMLAFLDKYIGAR